MPSDTRTLGHELYRNCRNGVGGSGPLYPFRTNRHLFSIGRYSECDEDHIRLGFTEGFQLTKPIRFLRFLEDKRIRLRRIGDSKEFCWPAEVIPVTSDSVQPYDDLVSTQSSYLYGYQESDYETF